MCARAGARGIHTNSRIFQHVRTYHVGSWPPPLAFPSKGLGHQSTMSKKKRLLLDLSRCIKLNAFANPSEVAMDYVPVLRHRLCAPLLADAADGVPTTLKMMDEYLLSKDELETITSELRLADIKVDGKATEVSADMYAKVDSKVKAALTRGYNKESHTVKFIKPKMGAAMMSKGKSTKAVGRSGEEKESDDDYVDDDEGTTLSAPVCLCRSLQSGRVDVFLSLLCFLVPPCAFNSAFPLAIFLNASTLCLVLWMQRKQKLQTFRKRGRLFPPKRPRRAVPPKRLRPKSLRRKSSKAGMHLAAVDQMCLPEPRLGFKFGAPGRLTLMDGGALAAFWRLLPLTQRSR